MGPSWFEKRPEGTVACLLCPNRCVIREGHAGICGVRRNEGGTLVIPYYGAISSLAMDPIEKKPLYHFFPGSKILSAGFVGCNLHCPFCQNFTISQDIGATTERVSPDALVAMALRSGSFAIAYTYSEPTIHFEYIREAAKAARAAGLRNVLVTNGYLNPEPARELLALMDAVNVDLKALNPEFYARELGGRLDAVEEFIRIGAGLAEMEVTTLVIPGKNDSDDEIARAAEFLASINPDLPYHLSCYYPMYHYTVHATPPETVERLATVARRSLRYVYTGNIAMSESNTLCPDCGAVLIRRTGYRTRITGLSGTACAQCGRAIPIIR